MAHIKRRVSELTGKTTYQVQIPQPGARRIVKTFERKRDAERWLIDQQSALQRGDYIDNKTAA